MSITTFRYKVITINNSKEGKQKIKEPGKQLESNKRTTIWYFVKIVVLRKDLCLPPMLK